MTADLFATIYMLAFAACGILIARPIFRRDDPLRRLFFGLVTGLVLLIWLPTLLAFLFSFTKQVQFIALGIAAAGAAAATVVGIFQRRRGNIRREAWTGKRLVSELLPLLAVAVPLTALGFILHINHTIVPASDGSLHVGQCTYGDLCMHLGFISSISVQQKFPPDYSILPGTPIGYPFLCDSVSSTFCSIGASLRTATLLPALYAFLVVVLGVYFFFDTWFKSKKTAVLASYMFFIGGGFGFYYIFNNKVLLAEQGIDRMKELLTGFYKTPTNIPAEGLRWVNAIADMLLPQRATLFGWALLFPALQLVYRGVIEGENRVFIPLGILAGALPLVHTHSFVALGIISLVLFGCALLRLLTAHRPGRNTALAARVIACFAVILALGVFRLLPISVNKGHEGFDLKATANGCIAFSIIALLFVVAGMIQDWKAKRESGFAVLATGVTAFVCGAALFGISQRSLLCVLAPLAGMIALVFAALLWRDAKAPAAETAEEDGEAQEPAACTAQKPGPGAEFIRRRRNLLFFILFGVIAVALAAPQLFGFTLKQSGSSESFLRWSRNWDNRSDSWLWFYIKNLGLIFLLLPVAFLNEDRKSRLFYCGGLAIFGICEIFLFQPNPYDNNKLLFVWFALSCGIVAHLIVRRLAHPVTVTVNGKKTVDRMKTAGRLVLLVILMAGLFTSGVLTLWREYVSADHYGEITAEDGTKRWGYSENGYEVVPAYLVELTDWVKANTENDATFLTDNNHNNAIAMLTGRSIFCGSGTFLHWHGVDYSNRETLMRQLYTAPEDCFFELAEQYGIDYVLISPYEYGDRSYFVYTDWFEKNLECVYSNEYASLYRVPKADGDLR